MSYVSLNDLITDEQVLEIAKQHILLTEIQETS